MSARLLSVVGTLDKINIEYSWLIENDDLWEQELSTWCVVLSISLRETYSSTPSIVRYAPISTSS